MYEMAVVQTCRPDSPDEVLLHACQQQDRRAQQYLYQRYAGYMMGVCLRYAGCRDEAGEMLNAGFFKVFQNIGQFEGRGSLKAWIAKVIMYTCIDWVRSQATYRKRIDYESERDLPIDNLALQKLAVEELLEKVQALPPATRMVFSLYVLEGYNHREIAEQLDISEGTSKWHLSKAKKRLQKMIKKDQK
jgi:RNA polymerase sigma factor (sigma-70 family)